MTVVRLTPQAMAAYLDIEALCVGHYGSGLVAAYLVEEVQRIVHLIATEPVNPMIQRYRVPRHGRLYYIVVIPTPTGVEHDVAVFWRFEEGSSIPVVLGIKLDYHR